MVEQEKEVTEDGKQVKIKDMIYDYEAEMEESYRASLMKAFKKTVTDGYFPFIVVDNVNDKVKYFGEMWSFAKQNGFQVPKMNVKETFLLQNGVFLGLRVPAGPGRADLFQTEHSWPISGRYRKMREKLGANSCPSPCFRCFQFVTWPSHSRCGNGRSEFSRK